MVAERFPEGNAIFQDDNASIPTAKIASEWHEEHSSEVMHLIWLPLTPDVNIIVNLRYIFEKQVRSRYSSLSSLKKIETVLVEEWTKFLGFGFFV